MKYIVLLLCFLKIIVGHSESDVFDYIESEDQKKLLNSNSKNLTLKDIKTPIKFIRKSLENSDLTFNGYLPTIDLFDNGQISSLYGLTNIYTPNGMTRIDTLGLGVNINPGDIISGFPIFIGLKNNSHILYARFFDDPLKAKTALPPKLKYLPVNAHYAKKQMKVGEIVGFEANLNLSFGVSSFVEMLNLASPVNLSGKAAFILSGNYFCQVMALEDGRFRIRFKMGQSSGAKAQVGIKSTYTLTQVEYLNKAISNVVSFDIVDVDVSKLKEHQIIADYIFNLNTEEGRRSFNNILAPSKLLRTSIKRGKFLKNLEKIGLVSNLSYADKIHYEDVKKEISERRVLRFFKGNLRSSLVQYKRNAALLTNKFKFDNIIKFKDIKLHNNSEYEEQHFYNLLNVKLKENRISFGLFRKMILDMVSTLFDVKNGVKDKIIGHGLLNLDREHFFTPNKLRKIKRKMRLNTPESIYSRVRWNDFWNLSKNKLVAPLNGIIISLVVLNNKAFDEIMDYSLKELREEYRKYYKYLIKERLISPVNLKMRGPFKYYQEKQMLTNFYQFLHNKKSNRQFLKFQYISRMDLFKNTGVGFILYLLEKKNLPLEEYMTYSLVLKGPHTDLVTYQFGNSGSVSDFLTALKLELGLIYDSTHYSKIIFEK